MLEKVESHSRLGASVVGWTGVGLMALAFAALFLINYIIPLQNGNYSTRLWDWSDLALAAGALVVIGLRWRSLRVVPVVTGAALSLVSGLSRYQHGFYLRGALTEAVAVWLAFIAGNILFQELKERRVAAFQLPISGILRGLGWGLLLALPLAGINNLFFFLQKGAPRFQNLFASAVSALSPGIHEEVVFRYFILAVCFALLRGSARPRLAIAVAVFMAVVPHSLLHLPDLFLTNPMMAVAMLAATSLLFGLPMALLQVRRSFESAVAFHWLIDFVRFFFGY